MLHLAAELKQPVILYGGRETFRPEAAALLKKYNTPILLSMRGRKPRAMPIPTRWTACARSRPATRPRSAPAVLQKAGVKFALYSDGLDAAARPAARRQEGARRRALARRRPARADAFARRDLRRRRPPGLHREGQDRQPRGHARRDLRRPHQGGNDLRGWQEVRAGGGGSARRRTRRGPTDRGSGGEVIDEEHSAVAALLRARRRCARQTYVIKNATVMTVSKGTFKGSILVKDGKIAEVGEKVMEPPGAKIIDAANQYVIPGIIDCHSHIAADGGINEGSVSVSSMVDIKDVINPEDIAIYRALAGGVTTANILHGSRQRHRRQDAAAQDALGQGRAGHDLRRRHAGHQVRARRESQARRQSAPGRRDQRARRTAALSRHPHGRGRRDPRSLQRRQGLQGRVGRLRRQVATARPAFRRARI